MISIGFRVTSNKIHYAILEENEEELKYNISELIVPVALKLSDKLAFCRTTIQTLIRQREITLAGIKLREGCARNGITNDDFIRFYLEGVILETMSNSSIKHHLDLVSNSIISILGKTKNEYNIDSLLSEVFDLNTLRTDSDYTLKQNDKEALLVAYTALIYGKNNERI